MGKNIIIFGVPNSSSAHIDNKKKDVLILGKGPTQRLDDAMLTTEAQNSIDFSRSNRKFCIIMGATGFYLLMSQKYINSKKMVLKWKKYPLCLGNISKDFSANDMRK